MFILTHNFDSALLGVKVTFLNSEVHFLYQLSFVWKPWSQPNHNFLLFQLFLFKS